MLESFESFEFLLTHLTGSVGPIPTVSDPDGSYPYESYCETSKRPVLKKYRMVYLENDDVRVKICPDLGGRVCSLFLKKSGTESLFFPSVIRPVRILPTQAFTGGGIELSFPISHSPVETASVCYEVSQHSDRIYVCCGERELKYGMHWTVEYSLGEGDAFLCQRTLFSNPDSEAHSWMSWSNAGIPARPDTEFHFPAGPVLVHDSGVRTINWETEGPRWQADIRRMTGYFWHKPDCSAFGAFTPSLSSGLYHVADPSAVPGMKLWSDGIGRDERWVTQYTLNGDQCLEIQAGPLIDQSMRTQLQAGESRNYVEFWIPSSVALDLRSIDLPTPKLRPLDQVPRFDWARCEDVRIWFHLQSAHRSGNRSRLPKAPDLDSNKWAPSGMSALGESLQWAIACTESTEHERWLFQYGAWLAGRGELQTSIEVLSKSSDDRARALCGRLHLVHNHDCHTAARYFRAIESEAFALHPQVVYERDQVLAALGEETLEERRGWLEAVSALEDEWLVERRASYLIDRGDFIAAMKLLKVTRFQLVHQRYKRTALWRQIESALGLVPIDHPAWLGEDDLAEFGAYRDVPTS